MVTLLHVIKSHVTATFCLFSPNSIYSHITIFQKISRKITLKLHMITDIAMLRTPVQPHLGLCRVQDFSFDFRKKILRLRDCASYGKT